MSFFVLFESAAGYSLFERAEGEDIAAFHENIQRSALDFGRFSRLVHLKAFVPFSSAENALENINCISEGAVHDTLKQFLEMNLPVKMGKGKVTLGVSDQKLGQAIHDIWPNLSVLHDEKIQEISRGIRLHLESFVKDIKEGTLKPYQLGLAHSYSRAKVKFNVNRADNMIIQSISLLDKMDKDINTFSMRVREWYSWHFPELAKIVNDNTLFAKVIGYVGVKSALKEERVPGLEDLVGDPIVARQIFDAARASMGMDLGELDMLNIEHFAARVVSLTDYRKQLVEYLNKRMHDIAPNLSCLVGEVVAARLIAHAGSLMNLAKYPASTVQILGAEKALFRALKKRQNTPKYGLIFHSSFISRAATANKGRISRYLANKCSIASRIDCFSDVPTMVFGKHLHDQVEDRLTFYDSGTVPRKNLDVMHEAASEAVKAVAAATPAAAAPAADGKKSKKDKKSEAAAAAAPVEEAKKEKKDKKKAKEVVPESEPESEVEQKKEKKEKKSDKKDKKSDKKEKADKAEKKSDKADKSDKKEKRKRDEDGDKKKKVKA